ncbi:MAG: trypsin-like peptidase domain-containing protein [Oscillospiraceae bacterium]|nr:trypsin-like peptidase domain-containing protein [Oscillospiraceae bacterium]
MKKLKLLSLALCATLLIGSTTASASNEKLPAEGFTLYSYCPETGEEKYIECDTSYVDDLINSGATVISTPSSLGETNITGEYLDHGTSPNYVIPGDTRYKITNTTKKPYSSICLLEIFWTNGEHGFGTGCLVGPDLVLTAAHNTFKRARGGKTTRINIFPGYNGDLNVPYNKVYGEYMAKDIYSPPSWYSYEKTVDDWAIIKIGDPSGNPTTIGNTTGYLGFDYISEGGLTGVAAFVTGYPGDKKTSDIGRTMWRGGGYITRSPQDPVDKKYYLIYYDCDTDQGNSGSPVTNSSDRIIGIHVEESRETEENVGVRVTKDWITAYHGIIASYGW